MCFRLALGEKQRATPPLTYYVLRGAGHRIMFLKETHSLVVSALQPHCVFLRIIAGHAPVAQILASKVRAYTPFIYYQMKLIEKCNVKTIK